MKNVLVVGGAGFIGSALCRALLEKTRVVCLDNLMRGKMENISDLLDKSGFTFCQADANDFDFLKKVVLENSIDYIFHLAANSDIQFSAENPQIEFDSTCKTTWTILRVMKETGIKKLFFASTSAVYGEMKDRPFKEGDPLSPVSYYGSAKKASESFIEAFSFMNGIDALIFRFPNVIGPNLTHGVIYDFIRRLKADGSHLDVLGNGSQIKPYLHVFDLISAIDLLCWDNVGLNIFNVGPDSATRVAAIAEMVIEEMGLKNCTIRYGTENVGWKGDVPKFAYCLQKIESKGWRPSMTSDEAVRLAIKEALR